MKTIYQVDAFTSKMFSGNPAGVCLLEDDIDPALMQNIAREMNLSETAFVKKSGQGYQIRFFTPITEIDICGHATLSSAHILWQTGLVAPDKGIDFTCKKGPLHAHSQGTWIELDFPAIPEEEIAIDGNIEDALGVRAVYMGKNDLVHLVRVQSEAEVRNAKPNFSALKALTQEGLLLTSACEHEDYDFVSRCFFPNFGIDEDPATGVAHCVLGPFWAKQLQKTRFKALQASKRQGVLKVKVKGDRIFLAGQAITAMKCELL